MKIKGEYVLDSIGDEKMAVPLNTAQSNQVGIIKLNAVGAFLWSLLEKDTKEEELVKALADNAEVDSETAGRDVKAFLNKLDAQGILER